MSALQPIHALNLDSVQQQAFIKYFNSLPEKPPTTVRIFDRNDYYSVHGLDTQTASREVFSSISNIKKMGIKPNQLDYLVLSKGNFEILIKKLLLVRRYRVEIYVAEGSVKNSDWVLKYKGSPGCLSQLEEVLGEGLGSSEENTPCLMAVNIKTDAVSKGRLLGVACISAGDYQMSVTEFTDDDLLTQLETITVQMAPSECLVPQTENEDYKALKQVMARANVTLTKLKKTEFSTEGLHQDLNRLLKFKDDQQQDANAFPETRKETAMTSLAAAIKYISLLNDSTNFSRFRISTIQSDCYLHLDAAALAALNVFPELGDAARAPSRSLLGLLDRCRTQQGKRLLAQWLRQPLRDINLINERLDVVELLVTSSQLRLQLHEDHLRRIPDLQALARRLTRKKASLHDCYKIYQPLCDINLINERLDVVELLVTSSQLRLQLHEDHLRRIPDLQALARRLTRKKASLHDCYKIYQAISRLPSLLQCLAEANNSTVHSSLSEPISELNEDLNKYQEMIETTVDMFAVERGDFLVKPSFDEQLQSLSEQLDQLQSSAEKELNKAARDLGLEAGKTIKLEINPQGGFSLRVTMKEEQSLRGNKKYTIVDAVKGGVRFKTDKLGDVSEEYVETKSSYEREQDKVVAEIVGIAAGYSECLFCLSHILARLDVLVAFAVAASAAPTPYVRPVLTESLDELVIKDMRHPCLEVQEGVQYIPNDVTFKRGESLMHIVTGANMGGKSTWMRSCGTTVLLAHAGSLVPATAATVPLMRALAARVNAHDRESEGQSTFMLEMVEAAAILRTATPDSLVLVDELGRGTSTYEGCGIAWAIAEELATKCKCFCLFATHYHELTRLPSLHSGVIVNSHAEASVVDNQLVLLHQIRAGPAAHSLGLHVAKLADLPQSIIDYAEEKQAQLETNLFEVETSMKSQEATEGQTLILEFLKKCKQIQESTASDDTMMKEIGKLKKDLLGHENKFVQSLIA